MATPSLAHCAWCQRLIRANKIPFLVGNIRLCSEECLDSARAAFRAWEKL